MSRRVGPVVTVSVPSIKEGLAFYEGLGFQLLWQATHEAGLQVRGDDGQEVVLKAHYDPPEDLYVADVAALAQQATCSGGTILDKPSDTTEGRAMTMLDPFGNVLRFLDSNASEAAP